MHGIVVRDLVITEVHHEAGKVDLAHFTAELPGILLNGCRLQITTHKDIASYPPSGRKPDVGKVGAHITNPEWRREMTRQAIEIYHAAGGKLGVGFPIYPSTPIARAR